MLSGCLRDDFSADIEVYSNDFESNDLYDITGGRIVEFNGGLVNGNYNNEGFQLHLNDLPEHVYMYISFDLLIHDSWDGNFNDLEPDAPDLWIMELNPDLNEVRSQFKFETTFSNSVCTSRYCLQQSYPNDYPFINNPKIGSTIKNLPGFCTSDGETTLYKITKQFKHYENAMILSFYDKLLQSNVADPKCDESWSIDNITVRALNVD
jgi:hypothetical protein